jgi:hypothetical protein
MRVAISNFSRPVDADDDYERLWDQAVLPSRPSVRQSLFEQPYDWGFHVYSLGVHLMDEGVADAVEFWDYARDRSAAYLANGVLRMTFHHERDLAAYLARTGPPDLLVNHGVHGESALALVAGRTFRVHVPTLRTVSDPLPDAECYLLDAVEQLVPRSMLYIPVVNTAVIRPRPVPPVRDFLYLAACYEGKRQDIVIDAVRGTGLTGHFHPVGADALDLTGTRITTSDWDERSVVELLQTSRIAVYPGDHTSNPAAMWECVAAGLPIVMNDAILGGKHLVVPGVTGELAAEADFGAVMGEVLARRADYSPRAYFEEHWDTLTLIRRYLAFFRSMGWME